MGIVLVENILRHIEARPEAPRREVIREASAEVGGAVLTAGLTTIIGFLPVFVMTGAEGKLFTPLAWTKTFAIAASIILALAVLPPMAHLLFGKARKKRPLVSPKLQPTITTAAAVLVLLLLAHFWQPLGPGRAIANIILVGAVIGSLLMLFRAFLVGYPSMLAAALRHRVLAMLPAACVILIGLTAWLGFDKMFGFLPGAIRSISPVTAVANAFPGLGREFMPALDEGSFLYMPTTMPHASVGEAMDVLQKLDLAMLTVPEVTTVTGKIGRAETPLDPAPISMIETIIEYSPEYRYDEDGTAHRLWRDHIKSPQDIWDEIVIAAQLPGTTSAPKLQPIETRIVMLQSGFRAPMGIKVQGPTLQSIEAFSLELERVLKTSPGVREETVFADRVVGKPYLEIDIDRQRIARYGMQIADVQEVIEAAIGGQAVTRTVEGRERYNVRVRYQRELRDSVEAIEDLMVFSPGGAHVPLRELADITYRRGPQAIKGEDGFLVAYVIFDRIPSISEVDAVEQAAATVEAAIASGDITVPPGVNYRFAGAYENQVRASKRLMLVIPLALALILVLLHLQFKNILVSLMVFGGVFVAWGGGFLMLWLYGQPWFMDISLAGTNLRDLMHIHPINLSVAVWVGFLALFGIATDDGVVMATRLQKSMRDNSPKSVAEVRSAIVEAGSLRVRACLMTSATTILALLPVLTASGRGADIMIPMAIPVFGGMIVALLTLFVVPVLFSVPAEWRVKRLHLEGA
jgi:Cu(I)/Ag(I) efflux system membrane protein CusA/SilA